MNITLLDVVVYGASTLVVLALLIALTTKRRG
jgi:hypothetical protein